MFYWMCMHVSLHKQWLSVCVCVSVCTLFIQLPERELVSIFMKLVKHRILALSPNYTFQPWSVYNRETALLECEWLNVWFAVSLSVCKGSIFVLPFTLMMMVELTLSFLSLFNGAWGLPGIPTYRDLLQAVVRTIPAHMTTLNSILTCSFQHNVSQLMCTCVCVCP